MSMQKTLGGDRLGSGKKMKVTLEGYERSTHDLGYVWRSTMSAGTLVPFLSEVALPGDTFDINLGCDIKTLPTTGPLFGSYKTQLDIFIAPLRLYNSQMHNNTLGIGRNMSQVKLPQIRLTASTFDGTKFNSPDNTQINPSSLLAHLDIAHVGFWNGEGTAPTRDFNAVPILMLHEVYKDYYANKQEEIGAVIHTPSPAIIDNTSGFGRLRGSTLTAIAEAPATGATVDITGADKFRATLTALPAPDASMIMLNTNEGLFSLAQMVNDTVGYDSGGGTWQWDYNPAFIFNLEVYSWRTATAQDLGYGEPAVVTFPLSNIDDMRKAILNNWGTTAVVINGPDLAPYKYLYEHSNGIPNSLNSQEGLLLKTYQSDLFNNWLKTENIDAITTATTIDTTGGGFNIDTLRLTQQVWKLLNRINVSGGSYDDWQDAVWAQERYRKSETPMYMGGLIKELVFQEVVSNTATDQDPLGTLAGKGVMAPKHKGGTVIIKVDEPSWIMGIVSLTPRVDYSQGNKWHMHLKSMDDLHKPLLDQLGFQDLITEQMAAWTTVWDGTTWVQKSAGKQPAWINYMTNVNKVKGNFAIPNNQMFMVLNRKYIAISGAGDMDIQDLTTYIDPAKFNNVFAQTSRDAQNFMVQIGVDMIVRRKMSHKIMPNI